MRKLRYYVREAGGASAAEFALVMIPFIGLVLAIIGGSMMFYANESMQYATEAAARYWSVQNANTGTVLSPGTVQTYASNAYTGPGISPTFVAATGSCGYQVTGTATFPLNIGIYSQNITLQSHACFP